MSVADAIARKNFRRAVEAEKNRTTHLPSLAQREAANVPADDIYSLAFSMVDNDWPLRDPEKYGHDCLRLFGAVEGLSVYANLVEAARLPGGTDAIDRKAAEDWPSFDRERVSTDKYLVDLCEKMRGNDDGIDLYENPDATGWQPPAVIAAELDRLTDEAEATRAQEAADEIAADKAECAAREAEWDAEDKAELDEMIAAGHVVVSLKDYRIAKSKRDLPTAAELAWREFENASARLVEAGKKVKQARNPAELNAAIKERVAATEAADLAKQVAHAIRNHDAEWDAGMAKVDALAAKIRGEVLSAVAASRPSVQMPSNWAAQPLPMPRGAGGLPMLATQETVADLGRPILDGFLVAQTGAPHSNAPNLPEAMKGHPLLEPLNAAIGHVVAIAERRGALAPHVDVLAVLAAVHPETCKAVVARVRGFGCALPESRLGPAIHRFEASVAREVRVGSGWRTNRNGEPDPQNADNVAVLIRFLGVELRFNVWRQRIEIRRAGGEWQALTDAELNSLRSLASCAEYGYRPTKEFFRDMLGNLARQTSYDPVLDYIDSAKWDGKKRLDTWLPTCCGVSDDDYHTAIGRNVVGGIVKRARHAGVKHDEVMILIGKQGCGKSNLTKVLALRPEWHTDGVTFEGRPQDIVPQFHGKLVIELSELDGMHRRDVGSVKRIISTSTDNFTAKYEAYSTDFERRFIFIGTCNLESPLVDDSGNRRFYPVRIPDGVQINVEWLRENIEQLIAEAATLETAGDTFAIPAAVWSAAAAIQEEARNRPDFEILLESWFGGIVNPAFITSADLARLMQAAIGRVAPQAVGAVMRKLGFESLTPRIGASTARVWCKGGIERATQWAPRLGVDGFMRAMPLGGQFPTPQP